MTRKYVQKIKKRQIVEEYLIAHEHASNAEVGAACGVSERTVSTARKDAVTKGLIKPAYRDHRSPETSLETHTPEQSDEILRQLHKIRGISGEPLTQAESLQMLANMAREAFASKNPGLAKDALLAHDKISARASEVDLGLPDPLTTDEKILRTADILDVVGPSIAAHALIRVLSPPGRLTFEEEYGRLKATHPLPVETPGAPIQTADSSPSSNQS